MNLSHMVRAVRPVVTQYAKKQSHQLSKTAVKGVSSAVANIAPTGNKKPIYSIERPSLFPMSQIAVMGVTSFNTLGSSRSFSTATSVTFTTPYALEQPPLNTIILYNQSANAANVATTDLKDAFPTMSIIQVCQEGRGAVKGVDGVIHIPRGSWGNMDIFESKLNEYALHNPALKEAIQNQKVGIHFVWSSMAEDEVIAHRVGDMGLKWIGASPNKMGGLDKIAYKELCQSLGILTADFITLPPSQTVDSEKAIKEMVATFVSKIKDSSLEGQALFVKSEKGGGGRGTAKVANPTAETIEAAIRKVFSETKSLEGIYAEKALDLKGCTMIQLELEIAGKDENEQTVLAPGGRVVYFNERNQKMIEIGLTDAEISKYLTKAEYEKCRADSLRIGEASGYDSRGTNEILMVKKPDGTWDSYHGEFNKRVQVEHKALSRLYRYESGQYLNTIATQVMVSCGYPAPREEDLVPSGAKVVAHVRLINPEISPTGSLTFHSGVVVNGIILPKEFKDHCIQLGLLHPDADAQFGNVIIEADSMKSLCKKLERFGREAVIHGVHIDNSYFKFLQQFAQDDRVKNLTLGCNQTFSVMTSEVPERVRMPKAVDYLKGAATELVLNGYRKHDGVKDRPYPTDNQIKEFLKVKEALSKMTTPETPFSRLLQHQNFEQFYVEMREFLSKNGGAMVAVFPRDKQQEAGDSESQGIQAISAELTSKIGVLSGYFGYEIGGAQFQTGLMRLFSCWHVITHGCTPNMPSNSLSRSGWLNALKHLTPEEAAFVLEVTKKVVNQHYGLPETGPMTPYFPYNFHAGNHPDQDIITGLMLKAGMMPIPCFAYDPQFTTTQFEGWVKRQFEVFESQGKQIHEFRIKNPGERQEWTVDEVWGKVQVIRKLYAQRYGEGKEPIIKIHNHNFTGAASMTAFNLLQRAIASGYRLLMIDTAPPYMTHNDNRLVSKALEQTHEQLDALHTYNQMANVINNLTSRFHNQPTTNTDPFSVWAGGTGSSDQKSALQVSLPLRDIEPAKKLGADVLKLGAIVTPYSEFSMRFGYACYLQGLKSVDAVKTHINAGGTINVAEDVLKGFQEWKTLLPRPAIVDKLLQNHEMSLHPEPAKAEDKKPSFDPKEIQKSLQAEFKNIRITEKEVALVVGYAAIGKAFLAAQNHHGDLTPFLKHPELLYAASIPVGTLFTLFGLPVELIGKEAHAEDPSKTKLTFRLDGEIITTEGVDHDLAKKLHHSTAPKKHMADLQNKNQVGLISPGAIQKIMVKPGQVLEEGTPLYEVESMKMMTIVRASKEQAGKTVKEILVVAGNGNALGINELIMTLAPVVETKPAA